MGLAFTPRWGEVFFVAIPSSGRTSQGHLPAASFHGPTWLTGGTFGPEAGLQNFILLAAWWVGFSLWLKGVKYPTQETIPDSST